MVRINLLHFLGRSKHHIVISFNNIFNSCKLKRGNSSSFNNNSNSCNIRQLEQQHTPEAGLVVAPLNVSLIHLNNIHLLGAVSCTNHMVIPIMLNHQDKALRGIIGPATAHNMIGELSLHRGVLYHAHIILQDNLKCHLDLICMLITNDERCHQTESDAMLG
jgi:hypothetical protein